MSVILGIAAFHAGSSACLVVDGVPVFAVAEERLNRIKYYAGFPTLAIKRCLDFAGLKISEVDHVAVGRDPSANRWQKYTYALSNPKNIANYLKIGAKANRFRDIKTIISDELEVPASSLRFQLHNVEHHIAHVASSYFISPWESCASFSVDGSGDFASSMLAKCEGDDIDLLSRIYLPHSLGNFYTMVCEFIGFGKYGDEGKVMGLAPYGEDTYAKELADIVSTTPDGFKLNKKYFETFGNTPGFVQNETGQMIQRRQHSSEMVRVFGEARAEDGEYEKRDLDLAFGVQSRFEDIYLHMLNVLHKKVPSDRVALAGGCALNSVVNGKLFDETPFTQTEIQPAAGDDGLSMGAALYVSNTVLREGKRWQITDPYFGDSFNDDQIKKALEAANITYKKLNRNELVESASELMADGNVMGWFQGRMEWGPRALGNRSILVHPGYPGMKDILNERIKRREWFRPFAPAVLAHKQAEIFEHTHPSPFMLHVYKIKPEWREKLEAVNHEDNTGRLQTVTREENALYFDLITAFEKRTGTPVVLNTSFNENEPIVNLPSEAIDCFMRTKMDVLAIGNFLCLKSEQKK